MNGVNPAVQKPNVRAALMTTSAGLEVVISVVKLQQDCRQPYGNDSTDGQEPKAGCQAVLCKLSRWNKVMKV